MSRFKTDYLALPDTEAATAMAAEPPAAAVHALDQPLPGPSPRDQSLLGTPSTHLPPPPPRAPARPVPTDAAAMADDFLSSLGLAGMGEGGVSEGTATDAQPAQQPAVPGSSSSLPALVDKPIDLFKAIFEASDSSEDEDEGQQEEAVGGGAAEGAQAGGGRLSPQEGGAGATRRPSATQREGSAQVQQLPAGVGRDGSGSWRGVVSAEDSEAVWQPSGREHGGEAGPSTRGMADEEGGKEGHAGEKQPQPGTSKMDRSKVLSILKALRGTSKKKKKKSKEKKSKDKNAKSKSKGKKKKKDVKEKKQKDGQSKRVQVASSTDSSDSESS